MELNISHDDYKAYLNLLIKATFKILPLYEENNPFLHEYIDSLIFEINGAKKVLVEFDGALFVKLLSILSQLTEEIKVEDNHKFIRKTILTTTREISDYIK